jgi:hypothetical protein
LKVLFTFDVEVWCDSWQTLDEDFPRAFERYVFGRSPQGEFGLPRALETLDRHGLRGVFFVEPLFATRFGHEPLARIVGLLRDAGQEVQLHLHPEWADEARPPLLPHMQGKRQYLHYYSAEEQRALLGHGLRMMREVGVHGLLAFRAGSFACSADTPDAVAAHGLAFDSSVNPVATVSQPGKALDARAGIGEPFVHHAADGAQVGMIPMTVFRDGVGRLRHAQVGACSARELQEAMTDAAEIGWETFVLLSHNFELLVPGQLRPDRIVVDRFEQVCAFLAREKDALPTTGFDGLALPRAPRRLPVPAVSRRATATRYAAQLMRRLA